MRSHETQINGVHLLMDIQDGSSHESDDFHCLVTPVTDRGHEPNRVSNSSVVINLKDGESFVQLGLDSEQARRLEGALGQISNAPTEADTDE